MKNLVLVLIVLLSFKIYGQDVQLIIPRTSVENAIKTLLDARVASFSSVNPGFGVNMYNIRLFHSESNPLLLTLTPPNEFTIQCGILARANINYGVGNFSINGVGSVTLQGVMTVEGSNGRVSLNGTAEVVLSIDGVPDFVENIVNANEFTVQLPKFEFANFVQTLPSIPLNYFTTNIPTISIDNDNIVLGLQTPGYFLKVDQKDENGYRISGSEIGHWAGSGFQYYTVPKIFTNLPFTGNQTFKGSHELLLVPSQKYYKWDRLSAFVNYYSFPMGVFSSLTSQFRKTYNSTEIRNSILEAMTLNGGSIKFKDPWLSDYADPLFGNSTRNRGVDAIFKERSSPFYPDYTTNYNGDVYKGVFLDQDYLDPNKPYYSVQAISPQTCTLAQTGREHTFYFQNWSANTVNGVPGAVFQNANSPTTGVVFKKEGAVVSANMKGTQLSSQSEAFKHNGQNKIVRISGNQGIMYQIYESMGNLGYKNDMLRKKVVIESGCDSNLCS